MAGCPEIWLAENRLCSDARHRKAAAVEEESESVSKREICDFFHSLCYTNDDD